MGDKPTTEQGELRDLLVNSIGHEVEVHCRHRSYRGTLDDVKASYVVLCPVTDVYAIGTDGGATRLPSKPEFTTIPMSSVVSIEDYI